MCNNEQSVLKSSTLSITITIIVVSLFAGITYFIFDTVYKTQPNPYLDEIFHIPQAQKYCKWLFGQWDPKITTLPGLYLLSVGALTPLTVVLGRDLCNVYFLRFTNLVGCFINFYVLYGIQQKLHPGKKEIGLLSAFNLATFPLLYFFTFLYYTDTISTSLVLLMYLFHLYGHNFLSAASGFIAVIVRQTNIIWVGFILLKIVENVLKDKAIAYKRKVTPPTLRSSKYFQILLLTIQQSWKSGFSSFSTLIIDILRESSLFIIVCLSFVTFVIWNGSIVVGDKTAHQAVLNFPQLFYFSLFTLCFCFPYLITFTPTFLHWCGANKKSLAIILLICVFIVGFNSHVHPYLLADNRHYTFYIWKRVFERYFLFKYMLIPFYVFGLFAGFQILKNTSVTFCAFYIFCFMLCLVPQKLLEFRYFILPYLFLRLQIPQSSWWPLIIEFFIYTAINALTIYLFLSRTFTWADSPELQRFLW